MVEAVHDQDDDWGDDGDQDDAWGDDGDQDQDMDNDWDDNYDDELPSVPLMKR